MSTQPRKIVPRVTLTRTMGPQEFEREIKPPTKETFDEQLKRTIEQVILGYIKNHYEEMLLKKDRPTELENLNNNRPF